MTKTILVTGGTGKTGSRVAEQLRETWGEPRIATRNPSAETHVRFDWSDASTFAKAFENVGAIYLVAPTDTVETLAAMLPGLEAALAAGVKRFVLLSASSLEEGGPMMGAVHAWLRNNAPEWVVLRPTWFMQNFSELHHRGPIRDESAIYTATGDGRIGFIDAADIAACAAAVLVAVEVENTDYILTGPEAISYDDVAEALSKQLGRRVHHNRLTVEGLAARHCEHGLTEDYARTLAAMDGAIAGGSEDRVTDTVLAGDRYGSLEAIRGQEFDWVFDSCAYVPDAVRSLLNAVGHGITRYCMISSISAYGSFAKPDLDESEAVQTATEQDYAVAGGLSAEMRTSAFAYGASYGLLKRACEIEAERLLGERSTSLRVGLLVGAGDYTDRLTWHVQPDWSAGRSKRHLDR
eukprot:g1949.t1